jgi:hypothetical protein
MSKWIEFIEVGNTGKTLKFHVQNKEQSLVLGEIKWYGPFRQYSFFPEPNMVFEKTCLKDITDFIVNLMEERKKQKS